MVLYLDSIAALKNEVSQNPQDIFFWETEDLPDKKSNVSALARIEFAHKTEDPRLHEYLSSYFSKFGHKDSCFSYLQPYLHPLSTFAEVTAAFINSHKDESPFCEESIARLLSAYKFNEYFLQNLNPASLSISCSEYLKQYGKSKACCQKPFGDFIFLAILCAIRKNAKEQQQVLQNQNQALENEKQLNGEKPDLVLPYEFLMNCAVLALFGLCDDDSNFILKLFAIFLLRELGAVSFALSLYDSLNVKFIQLDILSYVVLDWIPLIGFKEEVFRIQKGLLSLYENNDSETPELLCEAYRHGSFSQVPEFLDLHLQLKYSIQRKIGEISACQADCLQLASKSNIEQFFSSLKLPIVFKTIVDNRPFLDLFPTWSAFPWFAEFLKKYSPKETSWIETCYAILLAMKSCFVPYDSVDDLIIQPTLRDSSDQIILFSQVSSLLKASVLVVFTTLGVNHGRAEYRSIDICSLECCQGNPQWRSCVVIKLDLQNRRFDGQAVESGRCICTPLHADARCDSCKA